MNLTLLNDLKESGQDFEFYPTTRQIIEKMMADISHLRTLKWRLYHDLGSVLDIGSGAGKVLEAFKEAKFSEFYAIEKSPILRDCLPDDVFIVGTDFHEQSLVNKKVEVTFCNPPYSEFEAWARKIIRESSSRLVYLVIPERWEKSVELADSLKFREAAFEIIGRFDFYDAEDRAARAKVHLIRIEMSDETDDAFDRFFEQEFAELKAKWRGDTESPEAAAERDAEQRAAKFTSLVVGADLPQRLVNLYDQELDNIRRNYDVVKQLDVQLLKEFDVSPVRIAACLKSRLAGLRNTYWQELFWHMKSITNRLTTKKRNAILNRLNKSAHVDFTVDNIAAILVWVLKNANTYLDEQILETFDTMVDKANVRNYKSNARVFTYDRWRYNEETPSHIALEYRIVLARVGGIRLKFSSGHELVESAADFLGDILTVAHCLGFNCDTADDRLTYQGRQNCWSPGERHEFMCTIQGLPKVIFDVRAFQNGNLHIRLNQDFALALNVEVGRMRGWIKSGKEAAEELGEKKAAAYFGTALKLGLHSLPMLSAPAA